MQYYGVVRSKSFFAHHGIAGQKWGVKNGPPYPLERQRKSYREAKTIADSLTKDEKRHVFGSKAYSDSKYSVYRRVAKRDGKPSAFIEVFRDPDLKKDEGIAIVATNPKYRGKGDAKKLVSNLTKNMPDGINKIYWETDTSNKGSMHLAESNGFKRTKSNYADDANYVYKRKSRNLNGYSVKDVQNVLDQIPEFTNNHKTFKETIYRDVVPNGGFVEMYRLHEDPKIASFAAGVVPNKRGTGLAQKMINKAKSAAPSLGINRLEWYCEKKNQASWKAVRKAGFHIDNELSTNDWYTLAYDLKKRRSK